MASDCSYNKLYIGSVCQDCPVGYFGKNCSQPCVNESYGQLCNQKCHCSSEQICDHRYGCSTVSGITVDDGGFEYISTVSFPPGSSNNYVSTDNSISTTSHNLETPSDTSNTPLSLNMQMVLIGGVIALFILILIVKSFIKLHLNRKQTVHKISIKQESDQEEDLYQAIADEAVETNENEQNRKYYRLRNSNSVSNVPNEQRGNYTHYQEIDENCDLNSSNSSIVSVKSNRNERQNYLDALGPSMPKATAVKEGLFGQDHLDTSTEYIEPVQSVSLLAVDNTLNNIDYGDNGAYLDVTNETIL